MTVSDAEFKDFVETTASRPGRREQGDHVFGVCTMRPEKQAGSNKLYDARERAEARLRKMPESPLYKPEMHAVVFYDATVSSTGPSNMRNTMVVDPTEEELLTLTDISLIETWQVGDPVEWD